jgi:hypothetical protein
VRINRLATVAAIVLLAVVTLGLTPGSCVWGQTPPAGGAPADARLQAELLKTIDASNARVGDEVTARTITALEFGGAKFPSGAVVRGHVAEAAQSRLLLVFDSIAVKKNPPVAVGLSLRAVMMLKSPAQSEQISPRAEGGGGSTGVDQALQNPGGRGDMLRSPAAAAEDSASTVFQGPRSSEPVKTMNGGVIGVPGVDLQVSSDPKAGAAFQADKDHKLRLEKGLQVMFVVSALP